MPVWFLDETRRNESTSLVVAVILPAGNTLLASDEALTHTIYVDDEPFP